MRTNLVVVAVMLTIVGCDGPKGSAGDDGEQGPPGPSTGPAGGALAGTYPNPSIANGAVGLAQLDTLLVDGDASIPSLRTLGSGGNQAPAGDDARLSDARVPKGSAGGDLTGTFPSPVIADGAVTSAKIAASLSDAAAGTPSLRSLGTGAAQAAAGNDSRLSDARVPSGTAGGALAGSYPSPTLGAGAITSPALFSVGAIPVARMRTEQPQSVTGSGNVVWENSGPFSFETEPMLSADGEGFVAPLAGIYRVECDLVLSDAQVFLIVEFAGGGGDISVSDVVTGFGTAHVSDVVPLAAGSRVVIGVNSVATSIGTQSSFSIQWVAP